MGVVPSHPESQALGMRWSISASSTEAKSTPLPARCDHLVIVAGVNVPRAKPACCLAPDRGSMSATARVLSTPQTGQRRGSFGNFASSNQAVACPEQQHHGNGIRTSVAGSALIEGPVPSTVTTSPSCSCDVLTRVAMTAGTRNSRAMIAGWDKIPPVSVTSAPTLGKRTDHTGDVAGHTSTSLLGTGPASMDS